MRKIFTVAAIMICSIAITSCRKTYNCQCTDPMGKVSQHTVHASNKVEASTNCSDVSRISTCELK